MSLKFKGVYTALVTPFYQGQVDYESLTKLVLLQKESHISGLVINGTTGESPTLSSEEIKKIFKTVRDKTDGKLKLILGTGSNSTLNTISATKLADELGADAALVVVPYYNKPPQRGLVQHFLEVANNSKTPLILYNVPGRTITSMTVETILELSQHQNIIGIKEASGDLKFDQELKSKLNADFTFLSGDDGTYLDFLKLGGDGIISVMSNLIPKQCVQWTQSFSDVKTAEKFQSSRALIDGMYVESNPIPIKWMLYRSGIIKSPELRLPLCRLDQKFEEPLLKLMKEHQLV